MHLIPESNPSHLVLEGEMQNLHHKTFVWWEKRKKNATKCQEDTNICVITMTDGTLYKIPACVAGFVLELNPAVQERPELLVTAPHVEGFIAVISPNYNKLDLGKYQKVWEATGGDIVDDNDADDCTKKYEP
ncbi:hypothetical protein TcCL_ESM09652 [Trypanosoma cruzi]|nr:hypothetical protein TcCL_ESM09652 [Trypanosoma cruzi]